MFYIRLMRKLVHHFVLNWHDKYNIKKPFIKIILKNVVITISTYVRMCVPSHMSI